MFSLNILNSTANTKSKQCPQLNAVEQHDHYRVEQEDQRIKSYSSEPQNPSSTAPLVLSSFSQSRGDLVFHKLHVQEEKYFRLSTSTLVILPKFVLILQIYISPLLLTRVFFSPSRVVQSLVQCLLRMFIILSDLFFQFFLDLLDVAAGAQLWRVILPPTLVVMYIFFLLSPIGICKSLVECSF